MLFHYGLCSENVDCFHLGSTMTSRKMCIACSTIRIMDYQTLDYRYERTPDDTWYNLTY